MDDGSLASLSRCLLRSRPWARIARALVIEEHGGGSCTVVKPFMDEEAVVPSLHSNLMVLVGSPLPMVIVEEPFHHRGSMGWIHSALYLCSPELGDVRQELLLPSPIGRFSNGGFQFVFLLNDIVGVEGIVGSEDAASPNHLVEVSTRVRRSLAFFVVRSDVWTCMGLVVLGTFVVCFADYDAALHGGMETAIVRLASLLL